MLKRDGRAEAPDQGHCQGEGEADEAARMGEAAGLDPAAWPYRPGAPDGAVRDPVRDVRRTVAGHRQRCRGRAVLRFGGGAGPGHRRTRDRAGPGPSPHPPAADAGPGSAVAAGRPAGSGTAVTRPADRLAVRAGRHDRGVGGAWVAGRALRPVREMTAAAQRISEDNLDERLAVQGPKDELKELGDTIDGLLERLEIAFKAQRRFVANASHELRTPLTTMRAALDVALAKPDPAPPQTMALAARLRTELDRIDRLLEAFLVLARAQHRSLPGQAVLPLDYVIANTLTGQAAAISARKLTVQEVSEPGGAWVAGSQALISRMVENVIDNAVCHNTDGGWIRITSGTADGRASVVVENGGPVLEQDQVRELSQPFRRIGADRTGSDSGSGLGLSIVAAIAEAHGGSLDLQARQEGGLRVSIQLPAVAGVPAGARA